jgi:hypothetical protein
VGLLCLLAYLRNFQYVNDNERQPMYKLLEECLGILGVLVTELAAKCKPNNEIALHILNLILKIFNVANHSQIVPFLTRRDRIDAWLRLAYEVLSLPVPTNFNSETTESKEIHMRNKHIFWKMKSQASRLTY